MAALPNSGDDASKDVTNDQTKSAATDDTSKDAKKEAPKDDNKETDEKQKASDQDQSQNKDKDKDKGKDKDEPKKLVTRGSAAPTSDASKDKDKKKEKPKPKPKPRTFHASARMVTVSSGRDLLVPHKPDPVKSECPLNVSPITRDVLLSMLKRENELRLSKKVLSMLEDEVTVEYDNEDYVEYQDVVYDASNTLVFTSNVVQNVQKQVISEFGYNVNDKKVLNYCLEILHSALYLYPNDKDILNSVYYLKYNRAKPGKLKIGDKFLDIKSLLFYNQLSNNFENIALSSIIKLGAGGAVTAADKVKPTLIFAGSMS